MGVRLGPGWQSPAAMPRRWLAGLFAVSAIFASLVAIFSSDQVHQLWGAMAACGYGLAVAAVLGWRKRGVDLALGLSFCGALVLPLGWMAAKALEQPEVVVVARSAWTLIHQGSPYAGAASLATTQNPNAYNPYLPVMTLFGLPRVVIGGGALTDPRVWYGLVFLLVFWLALRDGGARHPGRWAILIAASPVIAFELAVGGTDVPMVAFLCLGFALLWGAQGQACRPVLAGLALGVAAAMKATAWPAVAVAVALLAVRDGKRAVRAFILTVLAVGLVYIGPFPRAPQVAGGQHDQVPAGAGQCHLAGVEPAARPCHRGHRCPRARGRRRGADTGRPRGRRIAVHQAAAVRAASSRAARRGDDRHVRARSLDTVRLLHLPGDAGDLAGGHHGRPSTAGDTGHARS